MLIKDKANIIKKETNNQKNIGETCFFNSLKLLKNKVSFSFIYQSNLNTPES